MNTILEYLDWRGDLNFISSPFNEVDNVLLTQLSYVDFGGIVPSSKEGKSISLNKASRAYFEKHDRKTLEKAKSLARACPFTMERMAQTERFKTIRLSHYEAHINEQTHTQFAAMHIHLPDGTTYICFRGTDDTLTGWREDFNMLYQFPIEAQRLAVEYLNNTVSPYSYRKLRLGGHSKGGNLAIYAGVLCRPNIKRKIIHIFNNDGPGFWEKFVNTKEYQEMIPKIISIAPQGSIFGMLFEHKEEFRIVKSKQVSLLQHDAINWGVLGNHLDYADKFTDDGKILHDAIDQWMERHDEAQRKKAVEALFGLLEATNAKNIFELLNVNMKSAQSVYQTFKELDKETKQVLLSVFGVISGEYNKTITNHVKKWIENL